MNLAKCSARDGREEGAWGDITCIGPIIEGRLAVYYRHRPPVIGRVAILARSGLSRVRSKVAGSMVGATVHSWQNCYFQSLAVIPGNQSATFASGLGWGALLAGESILTAVFSGLR